MSNHTPSPWTATIYSGQYDQPLVMSDFGPICRVISQDDRKHEVNARLIASAPELLEALKAAREVLLTARQYFPKSIKNSDRFALLNTLANAVEPAIAKAEGANE